MKSTALVLSVALATASSVQFASAKSLKVLMIGNGFSHSVLEEWPQCSASAGDTLYRQRLHVDYGKVLSDEEIAAIPEPTLMDFHGDVVGSSRWSKGEAWNKDKDVYRLRLDSIHLNKEGQFLQALVWQAAILGADVRKLTYRPAHIMEAKAELMRKCAMGAIHACPACARKNDM